jgi:hypothetical protein
MHDEIVFYILNDKECGRWDIKLGIKFG